MNRRNFLKLFGIGAATAAAAPALLPLLKAAPKPAINSVPPGLRFADINFTTVNRQLNLYEFEERILRPAMEKMAKAPDHDILERMCAEERGVRLATRYEMNNDLLPVRADMAYLFKQQGAW